MRKRVMGMAAAPIAAAAIVSGPASAPAAGAENGSDRSVPSSPVSGAFFNNPEGTDEEKNRLVEHLRTLIRGAEPDSEIRVSVFQLKTGPIADELRLAAARGVKVKVVADSVNKGAEYTPYHLLESALGTDKTKTSWAMTCTTGAACIGNAGGALNHNKFYLFSRTLGATNVVVQSTANQSSTIGGLKGWNSTYATAGNTSLYDEYKAYFNDLAAMRKSDDYYNVRAPSTHGTVKTYFHPRASSDTMVNFLNYVSCFGSTEGGTSDNHRTIVRVAMWKISRPEVAKKLWELDQAGCYVDIVANHLDVDSLAELMKPSNGYKGPEIRGFKDADNRGVHEKNVLVDGVYNGVPNQRLVFTGTHNMTLSSLRQNDETTLKIDDDLIHGKFRQNFWDIRAAADLPVRVPGTRMSTQNPPPFLTGGDEDA